MKFELFQLVTIALTNTPATVMGRAEYKTTESSYYLLYIDAQGNPVNRWWDESRLNEYASEDAFAGAVDMKFELNQGVSIDLTKTPATVIGRSDYTTADPSYLLLFKDAQGNAVEQWWSECHLAETATEEAIV